MSNIHIFYRINILSVLLCMPIIMMFRDSVWSYLGTVDKIRSKFTCYLSNLIVKSDHELPNSIGLPIKHRTGDL